MKALLQAGTPAFLKANFAISLGGFACFLLLYGTQPLLPQMAEHFQVSPTVASLTVSASTMALALMLIPLSLVSDRYGRINIMLIALAGATTFTLLSAFSPNFELLVLSRAGIGLCIAGLPAAAMAYLGEELAPSARARAMGMYIAGNALGGMVGRVLSATITEWLDWRYGLGALGLIGLLCFLVFWHFIPPAQYFQSRSLQPRALWVDVRKIYSTPGLPWLFVTAFLIMGAFVSSYNYLGFRLSQAPFELGPAAIGTIFLLYALGSMSSAGAGFLTDRFGRKRVMLLMIGLMATGLIGTLAEQLTLIVIGLAVFTAGYFATHAIASGWVSHLAGERRALVSALYLSSYYLGSSVIGSGTGFLWSHGGWTAIVSCLLALIALVGCIEFFK